MFSFDLVAGDNLFLLCEKEATVRPVADGVPVVGGY